MLIAGYEEAFQMLCSIMQPCVPPLDMRHHYHMKDSESGSDDPRVMEYKIDGENGEEIRLERCGVHHIVQGWIQQGQQDKVSECYCL